MDKQTDRQRDRGMTQEHNASSPWLLPTSRSSSSVVGAPNQLKAMDEHGPNILTNLYWLFVKGYFQTTSQMQIEHRKIYGPLWKSELGPLTLVNMAQADLIEQVLRQDGKHPIRTDMPFLRLYQEMRNQAYGPLTE
ncbi:unnamed protein product [Pleuronectes platessa]|uniref:Uncharacterized protein n=1 Tax=Pleuronectes platessa TaxID=8262 RepID=A0A9N7VB43_PLEPL|nr:unnamed protein product [Pleuronectes platessa]